LRVKLTEPICLAGVNDASHEIASMGDPDETIREALKAPAVLVQYIEPDGPNDHQTVKQLFGILNDLVVSQAFQQAEQPVRNRKRRQQLPTRRMVCSSR
jgi:hypothetical protein